MGMSAMAVVLQRPQQIVLSQLGLIEPQPEDVVVEVEFSGISTGTERLLWNGRMPSFPGMGYPLVPGYEAVGRIAAAGPQSGHTVGQRVFVPGARCFGEVRGLFGASASRLVAAGSRVVPVPERLGEQAILLALAATAYHTVAGGGQRREIHAPELIVGHGVLGRLLARMTVAGGYPAPTVWETDPVRRGDARGYPVLKPEDDPRRDYRSIVDVSGDALIIDRLVARLAPGGEIVLAGFYSEPLAFSFAPAFMREATIRAAAEWKPADMLAVRELVADGVLALDGLITHHADAEQAPAAYRTAFGDQACLKMVLDWRSLH
jgi:3-hydroxyethyl bacteriochlorophyllide a dehydrogenase